MFIVSIVAVVGASYAFFNFTRTGEVNLLSTGTISFTSNYEGVELGNVFPISIDDVDTDDVNVATIELSINGYTDYEKGLYYKVTAQDVHSTIHSTYENWDYTILNIVPSSTGLDNVMLKEYTWAADIEDDSVLAYGKIEPNTQVNGKITFKVFLCTEYLAISDTINYDENTQEFVPTDEYGTTEEWIEGPEGWRVYMTTEEWNNLATNPLSFKIKVETIDSKAYMNKFPEVITNRKSSIHEIYFEKMSDDEINTRYNAATYKADASMLKDGSVKAWIEGDKVYVASSDTIYLYDGLAFYGFFANNTSHSPYITKIEFNNVNTSEMTSMNRMFLGMQEITSLDLSMFDTTNVINMEGMFAHCYKLAEIDLSSFNTSKVEKFGIMFLRCQSLLSLDLSHMDTSNVKKMTSLFGGCTKITTVYVSELWSTSSLLDPTEDVFGVSYAGYATKIVGGEGTTYSSSHVDSEYARIDDPANGRPGYFTYKAHS
jgi:surface protein